ncbi:MAG: hypothetical protein K2X71_06280 [Methylobacterium sp.]|uniref:hypothetical protein n=1 Tax=Methylobacterium sp. TaxID=409 RepID=UPI0025830694|nr:hypothetical protein [Methylobacterium sp.]MBY0295632.1 hypothetical protein [Methylobacterium sp.]
MAAALTVVETAPPLTDRIFAALTKSTTSATVVAIMRDLDAEASDVAAELSKVEARALDPLTASEAVEEAQTAAIRLSFTQKRLAAARERLKARLAEVQQAEKDAENRAAYEACKAETEACVALLRTRYEPLARELAGILERCDAVAAEQSRVNAIKPAYAEWLRKPEEIAFGITHNFRESMLASSTRLPDPAAPGQRSIWPKP